MTVWALHRLVGGRGLEDQLWLAGGRRGQHQLCRMGRGLMRLRSFLRLAFGALAPADSHRVSPEMSTARTRQHFAQVDPPPPDRRRFWRQRASALGLGRAGTSADIRAIGVTGATVSIRGAGVRGGEGVWLTAPFHHLTVGPSSASASLGRGCAFTSLHPRAGTVARRAPSLPAMSRNHLYLVDGSGYIFRAYHQLPPLTNRQRHASGRGLWLYDDALEAGRCAAQARRADPPRGGAGQAGSHTFRNDLYGLYKANRPPPPEDLIPQFPLIRVATRAFSCPASRKRGSRRTTSSRPIRRRPWRPAGT